MRARHVIPRQGARIALVASMVLLSALVVLATSTATAARGGSHLPWQVISSTESAKAKLHADLEQQLESGSRARVSVLVTVSGNPAGAQKLLDGDHTASPEGNPTSSIVVGSLPTQRLAKLASLKTVVAVAPVEFRQTGVPLGADPGRAKPDLKKLGAALAAFDPSEVPYDKAKPPKTSDLADLTSKNVLDAKSHNFYGAWQKGFLGDGSTVSVLDGGTDFGHPDLLGTWRTWSFATPPSSSVDAGWNGWPKAFDPYGTLIWLLNPGLVDEGLSWYTPTVTAPASCDASTLREVLVGLCKQHFSVRTGPARNFAAPSGEADHVFTYDPKWSKSGTVKFANHPDEYLMGIRGERPAFLVTDPHTAGVYDTVYVDLDDDYDFSDEKPVTKASPVSYRDMNGDGYTDMSGGLLYYISDGVGGTTLPGGPSAFGLDLTFDPGAMLAWTGDFDPGIGGHGTLTASNVVGQGVIAAGAPTFADVHAPGHTYPGAVIGGAPKAKAAPMGDIYFAIDFSSQFAYYLTNSDGIDVISNSYGFSDSDNDGFDASSQEAAIWSQAFGVRTTSVHSTGNGAPGYGTTTPPKPFTGIAVGASTQFGGTGWDSIKNASQITDNDVIPWSDRGPAATGGGGVDILGDGAYSPGDVTLNVALDGPFAWETWGGTSRSTPVVVGAAALVYQAQRKLGPIPDGAIQAREILKSSALDLGYDSYTQGSGSVQAGEAVKATIGKRVVVSPDEWRPGDYRGTEYDAFPHLLAAGASDSQTFMSTPARYSISDRYLKLVSSTTINWTSKNVSKESPTTFNAPDDLLNLTSQVKAHKDADLMIVRAIYPHDEFDPDADYVNDQRWTLYAYDWTDINHDGRLWRDKNHNGVVNHTDSAPDQHRRPAIPDFKTRRSRQGEYERFGTIVRIERTAVMRSAIPPGGCTAGCSSASHAERSSTIPVTT